MRTLVNLVVLATLLAVIAGTVLHLRTVARERAAIADVRDDVRRIERMLHLKAATGEVEVNGRGWPIDINPTWFGDSGPRNRLLSPDRPWLEIADAAQTSLIHPIIRQAYDRSIAAFWYNPATGAVRARVPVTISDARAVQLYNEINRVTLSSIFEIVEVSPPAVSERPLDATTSSPRADAADMSEESLDPTKPLPPRH